LNTKNPAESHLRDSAGCIFHV